MVVVTTTNPDGAIPGDPGGQQGGGLDDIAANEDDISAPGDDTLPPGEEDCRCNTQFSVTLAVNQLYLSPEFHPNFTYSTPLWPLVTPQFQTPRRGLDLAPHSTAWPAASLWPNLVTRKYLEVIMATEIPGSPEI